MVYSVELSQDDINFIKACVLGSVRRSHAAMNEKEAVDITNAAALAITHINESSMTTHDVMFINTCVAKTMELLWTDRALSVYQKRAIRQQSEEIRNKLAGAGVERTPVLNSEPLIKLN